MPRNNATRYLDCAAAALSGNDAALVRRRLALQFLRCQLAAPRHAQSRDGEAIMAHAPRTRLMFETRTERYRH